MTSGAGRPVQFGPLLQTLAAKEIELIIVGGVAAVLEGAPVSTFDLDVLVRFDRANLERLVEALGELDATYLDPAGRTIRPAVDRFGVGGQHLLRTRHGRLDVLGSIGAGERFEDLLEHTHLREVAGCRVRVLDLEQIIRSKEVADRPKDRAVLEILRATLEERDGGED